MYSIPIDTGWDYVYVTMCSFTSLNSYVDKDSFVVNFLSVAFIILILYFTRPCGISILPPILAKKSCVGLIALELVPTVNYWFKG